MPVPETNPPPPLFFIDLDDTVFQTARKMTPAQRADAVAAAMDRQGAPRSFMTRRQQNLIAWLNSHACLVPVTGRGTQELQRVGIPFRSWRIATHGAVILDPEGRVDAVWQQHVAGIVMPLQQDMRELARRCSLFFASRGYDAFVRINLEYEIGIYIVMKHRDSSRLHELYAIQNELFPQLDLSAYALSGNDNNISLLPRGIDKASALRYVLKKLRNDPAIPALGLGDSLSDLPFLSECDWWGVPQKSQLAEAFRCLLPEE